MVNELGPGLQGEVFSHLDVSHVAIPDGPWEEVR
jgi:hypothetical protein